MHGSSLPRTPRNRRWTIYWPRRTIVAIDTETTGLSFEEDRIIETGIAVFYQGQLVHSWTWLSNVEKPSHPDAFDAHQICDVDRWKTGIAPEIMCGRISAILRRCRENNVPVLAFNAPFDMAMLAHEFSCTGYTWHKDMHIIDPLVIDRHFSPRIPVFTKPHMRLQQMAARYGVSAPRHRALADAICAGYTGLAQTLHHSSLRPLSLPELDRRQAQWYDEWATRFRSFASSKQFEISIPPWPWGIS